MERAGLVLAVLLVIFSLFTAEYATNAAQDATTGTKQTAEVARQLALSVARNDYARAINACQRSTYLNKLFNDVADIVRSTPTPATVQRTRFLARVAAFTDGTNPNCENIPPDPKDVAPVSPSK